MIHNENLILYNITPLIFFTYRMTQQTKIVLIVVSCMVTGFIAVAVFLPSKDIQIEPIKTDIRRPIPQE